MIEVKAEREPTVGLSSTPTLYKLNWQDDSGEEVREYVRCGADILLNGLNRNLDGNAQCPVCGTTTQLLIVNGNIDGLEPRDAIIHVVELPTKSERIWIECESTHIFDKKTCLEKWVSDYKGKTGLVDSVENYHKLLIQRRSKRATYAPLEKKTSTREAETKGRIRKPARHWENRQQNGVPEGTPLRVPTRLPGPRTTHGSF